MLILTEKTGPVTTVFGHLKIYCTTIAIGTASRCHSVEERVHLLPDIVTYFFVHSVIPAKAGIQMGGEGRK